MSWLPSHEIVQFKDLSNCNKVKDSDSDTFDGERHAEDSKVNESLLLMKFYSLSTDFVSHLLSGCDGRELGLPFELTEKEKEIILYKRSTFILGRSGTGKTTVLTMKLFQNEQLYHIVSEGFHEVRSNPSTSFSWRHEVLENDTETKEAVLHQIFVTVSPRLCHVVKQLVSQLKSFVCGGNSSTNSNSLFEDGIDHDLAQFIDIPDSFVDLPSKWYPLVITFHKFLMMLDGTVGTSYFERFPDARQWYHGKSTDHKSRSVSLETFIRTREVNYDRFSSYYWPHFNIELTKKLNPSSVFTEIMSAIKGGLRAAGVATDGNLCREVYILLSEDRASTLSKQKREKIYDIFLKYKKEKVANGDFDFPDLVNDLHRRLKKNRYEGDGIDFVYIDEVQDLSMRQIALFKYICKNVDDGFVFAGDRAQTIARGIDFRFEDIRCLFYQEFVLGSRNDVTDVRKMKGQISDIFHLSQNFRTHSGVLKLAQSVVELIYHFFPLSIDILKPETSLLLGEAPVLLQFSNNENAIKNIFQNGENGNVCGDAYSFGAEQVILVRDDCLRKEICQHIGKKALVLTILECKGLEFQDVLLYNFFSSSPFRNQWRVIYEYMKQQDLLNSASPQSFPSFSLEKHDVLCSELKQLYVAITRTKQRLWVFENDEVYFKPMFDYWKKLRLVQVRQLDDSFAKEMQVASSQEDWRSWGIKAC
ncbi:uncharacterized protein LOC132302410 [Cornus florida]|uniref:uncharacterized protein LOC132302410 n=1 Tax=Cornus florida TaxID=4283 RepID=UPI00289D8225|nr:uncharacterized protein LOC132302410 [Cornus florida]